MNDITVYDGLTESERVDAINQFGMKAMTGKAAYAMNSKWAGDVLNCQKLLVEHGQWMPWVEANVEQGQQWANEAMRISNYWRANNLTDDDLKSIGSKRQVTLVMQSDKPATAPRSARKPADVVVSKPSGKPAATIDNHDNVGPVPGTSGLLRNCDHYEVDIDDDPTPDQPTQRQTAKGSEKVSEDKKPRTQQVSVEIVDEPESLPDQKTLSDFTFAEIIEFLEASAAGDEKTVAKKLRQLADKLDPPSESEKIPTANKLHAVLDEFTTFDDDLQASLRTWVAQKQKYKKTEWRYQSVDAFRKDMQHLIRRISEHGKAAVLDVLEKAQRDGWRGWDHLDSNGNGKVNGNGHRTSEATNNGSCLGSNGRPRVERAKITYK